MAESRSHGITSSSPTNTASSPELRLQKLASSSRLKKLIQALGADSKLVIVGGAVREAFVSGREVDLDLATAYPPEKVRALLEKKKIQTYETGLQHGTITAVVEHENIEITTFRRIRNDQAEYSDSLAEDLSFRDFTINAIAFDPATGKVIDPLGGIDDLTKNILRACGEARARFAEDPLRVMRMARFGPADGRKIEEKTALAAKEAAPLLEKISVERIRQELEKLIMRPNAGAGVRALSEFNILQYVLPELLPSVGFEQNKFHYEDVFEHTLTVLDAADFDLTVRLAALFHDIGKPASLTIGEEGNRHFYLHEEIGARICKDAMRRLRFSNQRINAVSQLVRLHMRPIDCGPAGVRRLMRDLGDNFENWKKLKRADYPPVMEKEEFEKRYQSFIALVESEKERLARTNQKTLAVDGNDLIELGEKPGKRLGNILKFLENLVIENPDLNNRSVLLERAAEIIKGKKDV